MGNKTSSSDPPCEEEMDDSAVLSSKMENDQDSLLDLDKLSDLCQNLNVSVSKMSQTITTVIFENPNCSHSTVASASKRRSKSQEEGSNSISGSSTDVYIDETQIQMQLVGMGDCIQLLIQELTVQLNKHSKMVGLSDNKKLIKLVKSVVKSVNDYMAMLIRNIRKIRRLLAEAGIDGFHDNKKDNSSVFDVIEDSQDVDNMLQELTWIEKVREELENNVILALLHFRNSQRLKDQELDVNREKMNNENEKGHELTK